MCSFGGGHASILGGRRYFRSWIAFELFSPSPPFPFYLSVMGTQMFPTLPLLIAPFFLSFTKSPAPKSTVS